jgi:trehalose 6-phosphate phosphatase
VAFLQAHLPSAVELHGLYGLEAVVDGSRLVHPEAEAWRDVVDRAARSAAVDGPSGLDVEHKGLSLTLHYRRQPGLANAALRWAADVAESSGLELRRAKMSVELHPPVAVDKGTVVEARAAGAATVAYLGDDEGDLPAFAALDRLAARGVTTVKVAVQTAEASPTLLTRADVEVVGPDGALELLRGLVGRG